MNKTVQTTIGCLLLAAAICCPSYSVLAQAGAPGGDGPIDIQANEQEFAGDTVIAKGNVRVLYKDSTVYAPMATLVRDPGGNPQKAVFTGHPHLVQGLNKIDAETLVFEMASSKIVADGRAHSEVVSEASSDSDKDKDKNKPKEKAPQVAASTPDSDSDDDAPQAAPAPAPKPAPVKKDSNAPKPPSEKIITDSDHQEYDRVTGKFDAMGHVKVIHGNVLVKADKLALVYGSDAKPETALFTGHVAATQDRNVTLADSMTYSLSTKRLQATGHVKSTVIQEHHDEKDTKDKKKNTVGQADPTGLMPSAQATSSASANPNDVKEIKDDVVVVVSDAQDYSKQTGRLSAIGSVRVYYQDTIGIGPNAILIRNPQGKCERVIFNSRAQITQTDKRWIADHIEMDIATKKVIATGNSKAVILKKQPGQQNQPTGSQTQVAQTAGQTALSASKVELPK